MWKRGGRCGKTGETRCGKNCGKKWEKGNNVEKKKRSTAEGKGEVLTLWISHFLELMLMVMSLMVWEKAGSFCSFASTCSSA